MASMRQLFPSHNPHAKTKRNFIKENIRNAKGCNQCIAEKKGFTVHDGIFTKADDTQKTRSIKFKSETDLRTPVIKYNMKIVNRGNSSVPNDHKNYRCSSLNLSRNENAEKSTSVKGKSINGHENKSRNGTSVAQNKDYHKLSHEKEESCKKEGAKFTDLSFYKKGEIPRYLQERLARLMKEDEEKKEREELAEKLGLNDPRCPPGHMLMPPERLKEELTTFCYQYEALIRELNAMPITRDSFRIRNRKIEIEKELKALDDKISLYRNGKVFIKMPE